MDDHTIKLIKPVKGADGTTVETLTMRELTVDENITLERQHSGKGTLEQDKAFFAMTCGVSPDVIGGMGQRDWGRLKAKYWTTLGNVEPEPKNSE